LLFETIGRGDAVAEPLAELSWSQLAARVQRLAVELQAAGFSPGDRLVHATGNSCQGVLVALASLALGLIEVPLDPLLDSSSQARLAKQVEGRWLRASLATAAANAEVAADPAAANWLLETQAPHGLDAP